MYEKLSPPIDGEGLRAGGETVRLWTAIWPRNGTSGLVSETSRDSVMVDKSM